jgi:hypothetical protein
MRGAIAPLPSTPLWRGAQFKKIAQGQLYLYCYKESNGSVTVNQIRKDVKYKALWPISI